MKSTVRVWARLKAGHACQREKLAPSRAQTAAQSHLPGRKSPRSQWALKTATRGPEGRSPRWRLLLSDRRQDHAETTALHTGDGSPSAGAEKGREGLRREGRGLGPPHPSGWTCRASCGRKPPWRPAPCQSGLGQGQATHPAAASSQPPAEGATGPTPRSRGAVDRHL